MNYNSIKNKILFLLLTITIFVFSIILLIQYRIEQNTIKNIIKIEREKLQNVYNYSMDNFYLMYTSLGSKLLQNEQISKAVKNQDRNTLIALSENFYNQLQKENPYLYNMHFHTKDSKSIVRIHKQNKYGDDLSKIRPMIVEVNKQQKIIKGIEIGKSAISYRVAFPIFYKKEHVGSLELGIKIDYLTNHLKTKFKTESMFVFHTKSLEYLMSHSKNKKAYKTLADITLFQYNHCHLPKNINFEEFDNLLHKNKSIDIEKSQFYLSQISELKDYANNTIGHMIFVIDINKYIENLYFYRLTIILSLLVFMIILFSVLYNKFNFFVKIVDQHHKKLTELTYTDELTKLFNRRKILEIISLEYKRSKRYKTNDSIIILDIDHFKNINDTYGHNTGDIVLKELSKILQEITRETDFLGRWGGEEFLIVATNTNINEAFELAEKLRVAVESFDFEDVNKVTCSFGVAPLDKSKEYKDSINNADKALYSSKETGRNKVTVF